MTKLDPKTSGPLIPLPLIAADETAPVANEIQDLNNPQPKFNLDKLTKLDMEQIGWWYETHHQCFLRSRGCEISELDHVTTFPRAEDGRFNLDNGSYRVVKPTNMRVKYKKEVSFALGVAMVRTLDGKVKGRQCKAYNYTKKQLFLMLSLCGR